MTLLLPKLDNKIITALPLKIRDLILEQCDTVDMEFGDVLNEANKAARFAYFPISCFISLLVKLEGCEPMEMGMIGDEGMLGATLVFKIDTTAMQSVVQGSGQCLRLTSAKLRKLLRENPALNMLLSRYMYVLMEQLVQSAACTYFHAIEQRLARWLLMSDDRSHGGTLQLTHEFLAGMLGVRRSGVTIAAGHLQKQKLIHYSRGHIIILDREGLEAVSCECYDKMNLVYARNFAK